MEYLEAMFLEFFIAIISLSRRLYNCAIFLLLYISNATVTLATLSLNRFDSHFFVVNDLMALFVAVRSRLIGLVKILLKFMKFLKYLGCRGRSCILLSACWLVRFCPCLHLFYVKIVTKIDLVFLLWDEILNRRLCSAMAAFNLLTLKS